jgi:glucokinase
VPVIAVDLGGTKVAAALVAESGEILAREHAVIGGRAGGDVARLLAERCDALVARARDRGIGAPSAVGVAVPGIYRAARGTVWAPNIAGWDDYPLRDELQHALGPTVRVVVDSDRAACILGRDRLAAN